MKNIQYLNEQVQCNTQNIDKLKIETALLEQAVIFEIILNQYAFEIQNLIAIINSAIHGSIHASVFSSRILAAELREIKVELPVGTALPLDINADTLTELFRISDIIIFQKKDYLTFIVKIPLVSMEQYTTSMYHPIPLPIPHNYNSYILVDPEFDYLVLNDNNEKFFTLTENQCEACNNLRTYKLCKDTQLIHHHSRSNLCEIAILTKMQISLVILN